MGLFEEASMKENRTLNHSSLLEEHYDFTLSRETEWIRVKSYVREEGRLYTSRGDH